MNTEELRARHANQPDWIGFQVALLSSPLWQALGIHPAVNLTAVAMQDWLTRLSAGEFGLHNERIVQFRGLWNAIKVVADPQLLVLIRAKSQECRLPKLLVDIILEEV